MLIPIPETATATLIETSFAQAIEIISNSPEVPELKRRHWATSLRQIGKLLGRPLELIPARYSAVRADLRNLHHVPANAIAEQLPDWPKQKLVVPPPRQKVEVPWESFPAGLRADVEAYLKTLTRIRKGRTGQRIPPARPATIITQRRELQATARMALKVGVPMEQLTSLSALLKPDVAERVLDAYWEKNGELPKLFTVDLARRFVLIAVQTGCLTAAECDALRAIQDRFPQPRKELDGMTDKNIAFLRQVLTDGVWGRVVKLPYAMMDEAKRLHNRSPVDAAVMAQMAVAIAIETIAPVRLANLTSLRLGVNLIRPGGPNSNYWLVFPDYDVKNRVKLNYPLTNDVTGLINDYVQNFWPRLLRGRGEEFLFPGMRKGPKQKISFSRQISRAIQKWTGLRMTTHQFRHAAGAIILKKRPGEYELVRQLLGHKNIQTTMKAYIGLDSIHASEIFTGMISDMISPRLQAAE